MKLLSLVCVVLLVICQPLLADESAASTASMTILARWTFEQQQEQTCADRGPHALHATLSDKAALVKAPVGKALSLPAGSQAFAQLPASPVFDLASTFTIAAWVRPTGEGQMEIFCMKTDAMDRGFRLRNFWGKAVFEMGLGQEKTITIESKKNALIKDVWAHVAVAGDGKTLTLYVNAEQAGQVNLPSPPAPYRGGKPVIGNYLTRKDAYPFVGQIDDLILTKETIDGDGIYQLAQLRSMAK